jgi:DNA polymerase-4
MILHVDMDAFYASVEVRDDPALAGKAVVVGGSPQGRGVVAAASYEARKFGVRSAMAMSRAIKLCPHAIVLPTRMSRYAEISRQIRAIFETYTPLVEPLSLDEAFLDVRGSEALFGPTAEIGRTIKERIRNELKLIASVGVAPNKFLAKIASDLGKPDGFVVVEPGQEQTFLDPLPVGRIWGVGKVTDQTMAELGIRTIRDLRNRSRERLTELFGSSGDHYWRLAHGIDDRHVVPDREAKSISHETTFPEDLDDHETLRAWLVELVEQVARRLRRHALRCRTVELKIRFSDFRTITRSKTLSEPSDLTQELLAAAIDLLTTKLPARHLPIRLLGFGANDLRQPSEIAPTLFEEEGRERQRKLDQVADQIAARFGKGSIGRVLKRSEE